MPQSKLQHGIKNSALYRFQPIPGIGESASHDNAHGIIQVAMPHLLFQRQRDYLPKI
jgi:hypothetical protein